MQNLLAKMRKIDIIFERKSTAEFSFAEICKILSEIMDSNVYILNAKGRVMGVHYKDSEDAVLVYDYESDSESMVDEANDSFLEIEQTQINITGNDAINVFKVLPEKQFNKLHMIIPIYGGGHRLGTIFFARYGKKFKIEDVIVGEHVSTIVGIEIERRKYRKAEENRKKRWQANMAIHSLTGTELMAANYIFKELTDATTILVLKKIADRENITRSICLNALRKLESAGIIETTSFGSKGTRITVLNSSFYDLLKAKI